MTGDLTAATIVCMAESSTKPTVAQRPNAESQSPPIQAFIVQPPWYKNPINWFTAAAACAAVASAFAAWSNRSIASDQAAISRMQYTPQLAMNIAQLSPSPDGKILGTHVTIKNVGSITVYNAEVAAAMAYLVPGEVGAIWMGMTDTRHGVTLGPTEEEILSVAYWSPTEEQLAQLASGDLVLVAAGRIHYKDELGREHTRYVCGKFGALGKRLAGTFCPTPPQN